MLPAVLYPRDSTAAVPAVTGPLALVPALRYLCRSPLGRGGRPPHGRRSICCRLQSTLRQLVHLQYRSHPSAAA